MFIILLLCCSVSGGIVNNRNDENIHTSWTLRQLTNTAKIFVQQLIMQSDEMKKFLVISPEYIKKSYLKNQNPQVASLLLSSRDTNAELFDWDVITELDLSFAQIAHIGGLRLVRNLKSLRMANNCIRKIENLQWSTRLERLDLSHNRIGKIENLEALTGLRWLRLCDNRVALLENLDANVLLDTLDVSHNAIVDLHAFVSYAQRLDRLRNLEVAHNPAMCSPPKYRQMMVDWLPRLQFLDGVKTVGAVPSAPGSVSGLASGLADTRAVAVADDDDDETHPDLRFPDFLTRTDGVPFLAHLYHDDKPGKILCKWNSTVRMAFDTYCADMTEYAVQFHTTVLERLKVREDIARKFKRNYYIFERKWTEKSIALVNEFDEIRKLRMCTVDDSPEHPNMGTPIYLDCFHEAIVTLTDKLHYTNIEMNRSIEMMINKYEQILQEEIKAFLDLLVPIFFNLRQAESVYSQVLTENVKLVVNNTQKMIPREILNKFENRYAIVQAAFESTDKHTEMIYKREEKINSDANNWLKDTISELKKQETKRFWMVIEEARKYREIYYSWLDTLRNNYLN